MDSPGVSIDAANIADIVEGLAVPRGGVRVPRPIHLPLATYIVKTLGLESLDEFIAMGAESAAAALSSLDEDYPAPFVTCLRSWIMAPATKEVRSSDIRSRMGRVAFRSMEKAAVDSAESDGDESVMGVKGSRSERDAAKDSRRLGMPPIRITALSTSVHAGLIVGAAEMEGVPFGSDPGTLEWCRTIPWLMTPTTRLQASKCSAASS